MMAIMVATNASSLSKTDDGDEESLFLRQRKKSEKGSDVGYGVKLTNDIGKLESVQVESGHNTLD